MTLYKLGFFLLFYSHCLYADSYWSHIPEVGTVQLTALSPDQLRLLSEHLKLNEAQTTQWLADLPEQLERISCDSLEPQSQSLPAYAGIGYKLLSFAGVLKWTSDDSSENSQWWLPWSLLAQLSRPGSELANIHGQTYQPLVLTEQQLKDPGQLIVIAGSSNVSPEYFALQLNNIQHPRLLWSADAAKPGFADLVGTMAEPMLFSGSADQPELSVMLANVGADGGQSLLYKVDALSGVVQSRLSAAGQISPLSGAFTLYDQDMDRVSDTVVLSSKAGQLWQAQMDGDRFYDFKLIADLTGLQLTDMQFIRMLYAAVPVGGLGSDFHSRRSQWLLLLSASQQKDTVFAVLKRHKETPSVWTDLVYRPIAGNNLQALFTMQDWQQLQQKDGWYSQLSGRLTQHPVVVAGVIYLTLLEHVTDQFCHSGSNSAVLLALHLHHAAPVYRQQRMAIDQAAGALQVTANASGGFALTEQYAGQVLIENLLEITPDCVSCSRVMQQDSFPRWQLMGTYHSEEGAYE